MDTFTYKFTAKYNSPKKEQVITFKFVKKESAEKKHKNVNYSIVNSPEQRIINVECDREKKAQEAIDKQVAVLQTAYDELLAKQSVSYHWNCSFL